MRDIKFRAWVDGPGMIYCSGDFSISFDGSDSATITMWCSDGPVDEFNSSDVMQFTGLTDKNGVEIYEGDLIQAKDDKFIGKVIFSDDCWRVDISQQRTLSQWCASRARAMLCDGVSVVGNIYENPELLGNNNDT